VPPAHEVDDACMFLTEPPATPEAAALYDHDLADRGWVMNLTRAWAWRPEVFEAFGAARSACVAGSALGERDVAVLVAATASARGDSYCSLAWGAKLAGLTSAESAAGVLGGASPDALTEREHALADWARHAVTDPSTTTAEEVQRLRAAGLDDRDILSATVFLAMRLAFSTVNAALGVQPDAQLLADAPAPVAEVVGYGRPPATV
jgi:uncharacterized peroxidase-related enzyme